MLKRCMSKCFVRILKNSENLVINNPEAFSTIRRCGSTTFTVFSHRIQHKTSRLLLNKERHYTEPYICKNEMKDTSDSMS